ncbi:MAG TPA: class I SAM-dependent methyltransferase [Streptosporangiaceae bacterium]|nr:class I SAM-dependent methyltransferase [Streptosporangiaceae bacterium]
MTDHIHQTRATYDVIASDYAARWAAPEWVTTEYGRLSAVLPRGARVADVGCGPGHHTRLLRERGFIAVGLDLSWGMLRSGQVPAVAQADMRALPLGTGAVDAVWCAAALLHIPRPEVPVVLGEFARVLRPGGQLMVSLAEGDGEFAEPVSYQPSHQRWYVLHRLEPMTEQLRAAGFELMSFSRRSTHREWLQLRAQRR